MAKLKIKDIEGDAQEIKNLFKDMGCDLNSYLNTTPTKKTIPIYWLYILIPLFFTLTCLIWCNYFSPTGTKVCILAVFLLLGLTILIIHYNHNNRAISIISAVTGFSLILISLNVYTPQELLKRLEQKATEKLEGK